MWFAKEMHEGGRRWTARRFVWLWLAVWGCRNGVPNIGWSYVLVLVIDSVEGNRANPHDEMCMWPASQSAPSRWVCGSRVSSGLPAAVHSILVILIPFRRHPGRLISDEKIGATRSWINRLCNASEPVVVCHTHDSISQDNLSSSFLAQLPR